MPSYRGELRLPNKHAIAATHQGAADSNEAPPRRGRGAVRGEAWRGDDVASALARGHGLLGSGGSGIGDGVDADLLRKCCSVGSCCSRRAPGSWVRLRAAAAASTTSCLARPQLRGRESRLSKRCFAWHDRLAQGCQSLFARAGLPWHADPIRRVARRAFTGIKPVLRRFYEVYIPVPYLWYLKGTSWRYRSYDFQAPGLPTTETYSQLYLSSHRRISTQSDAADNKYEVRRDAAPSPTLIILFGF